MKLAEVARTPAMILYTRRTVIRTMELIVTVINFYLEAFENIFMTLLSFKTSMYVCHTWYWAMEKTFWRFDVFYLSWHKRKRRISENIYELMQFQSAFFYTHFKMPIRGVVNTGGQENNSKRTYRHFVWAIVVLRESSEKIYSIQD